MEVNWDLNNFWGHIIPQTNHRSLQYQPPTQTMHNFYRRNSRPKLPAKRFWGSVLRNSFRLGTFPPKNGWIFHVNQGLPGNIIYITFMACIKVWFLGILQEWKGNGAPFLRECPLRISNHQWFPLSSTTNMTGWKSRLIFNRKWTFPSFMVDFPTSHVSFRGGVTITLPETNSSHLKMDGWNTFLLGNPICRCFCC